MKTKKRAMVDSHTIEKTPAEKLRDLLDEAHAQENPNHDLPDVNVLSKVPFEIDALLTRAKVQQIVDEARLYNVRYLVHFRSYNHGIEHIVQSLTGDCVINDFIVRDWPTEAKAEVVQKIDLYRTTPEQVDKWINTFFVKAPGVKALNQKTDH
jgi:hypothetical protein